MDSPLAEELERRMAEQEDNPSDIVAARDLLEFALIAQFRALADGLLADMLLNGARISNLDWWQQYLSKLAHPSRYLPDFLDREFLTFRREFGFRVAMRQLRRISPAEMNNFEIRIYGGNAKSWQEGRINRQLASLGSSLRLLVLGSHRQRLHQINGLIGRAPSSSTCADGRFLLGWIGPVSVFPGAALFDFERESAASPYLPAKVGGLTDQARIAIRQVSIRIEMESDIRKGRLLPGEYEERLRARRRSALAHEASHILFDAARISQARDRVSSWHDAIREDICRFTQVPRSMDELERVFGEAFDVSWSGSASQVPRKSDGFILETDVRNMLQGGLLFTNSDGKIYCPLFEKGRGWTLS